MDRRADPASFIHLASATKTQANDDVNSALFDKKHLILGIESLKQIMNNEDTVRHLKF